MFGRVGGKSKLKEVITNYMHEHKIYVEPFIGGGSVFFYKDPAQINIINDLDKDIYYFYKDMKDVGEQMINKDFTHNREKFNKLKNQTKFKNNIERLYRNIYLSTNSFAKNRKDYMGVSKEMERGNDNVGKKYKTTKWKDFLNDNRVVITNKDFSKLIKKYDSKDTLFYLDPPYSKSTKDYTLDNVNPQTVFNALQNIKGKFILSYDYSPEIKKIFSKYKMIRVSTIYTKSGSNNYENVYEYLIMN